LFWPERAAAKALGAVRVEVATAWESRSEAQEARRDARPRRRKGRFDEREENMRKEAF
jgi:hypothetical protein